MDAQSTVITVEDGRAVSSARNSVAGNGNSSKDAAPPNSNAHQDSLKTEANSDAVSVTLSTINSNKSGVEGDASIDRENAVLSNSKGSSEGVVDVLSKEDAQELADKIEEAVGSAISVKFSNDKEGNLSFKILNDKGEVIREFPPEEVLQLRENVRKGVVELLNEVG